MSRTIVAVLIAVAGAAGFVAGRGLDAREAPPVVDARSPYAADSSPIRGLTAREVDDLLNGRGAGFARTAELNGHPGPRHAIEMAADLGLTAGQLTEAERIFGGMSDAARRLGREIVEREGRFSAAFAARRVTVDDLRMESESLGVLYGRLRAVHLAAHLELTRVLTADQIRRYDSLRGYHRQPAGGTEEHRHGG